MTQVHPVFAAEQAAMARWCEGDPDGFLEISTDDVTYFDPFVPRRIDGLATLKAHYDALRGKIYVASYEFVDVKVQEAGDIAVLTYHFHSQGSEGEMRWNCSEVFRKDEKDWRIIQTHWSFRGKA